MPGPSRPRPSYRLVAGARTVAAVPAPHAHAASRPSSAKMPATMPLSGSKKRGRASAQPPRSSMVKRLAICGKSNSASDLRDHRAEALLAEDALRLGRVQEVDEGLGRLERVAHRGHGHGVLDEHRRGRRG